MAKREMIVTGYSGTDAEEQVDPFLRHLIGKWTDELSEADRMLLEYTSRAGLPDLYSAIWDDDTASLSAMGDSPERIQASVSFGYQPVTPEKWTQLRMALNVTLAYAMEVE